MDLVVGPLIEPPTDYLPLIGLADEDVAAVPIAEGNEGCLELVLAGPGLQFYGVGLTLDQLGELFGAIGRPKVDHPRCMTQLWTRSQNWRDLVEGGHIREMGTLERVLGGWDVTLRDDVQNSFVSKLLAR